MRQYVQATGGDLDGVDLAIHHGFADRACFEQIVSLEHEDAALAGPIQQVARAADTLQAGCHGLCGLQLVDEIDGADVDPQFERRRRDESIKLAGLQIVFRFEAYLLRHGAVMDPDVDGMLWGGALQLAQSQRCPFRLVSAVGENECGIVAGNLGEEQLIGARPQGVVAGFEEVRQRRHHLHVQLLSHACIDDGARARFSVGIRACEVSGYLIERAQRGRAADPLKRPSDPSLQSFQANSQMDPAFVVTHGVHFIDDDGPDAFQIRRHLLSAEEQIERFRRGDQDVRRLPDHPGPFALGSVTRADSHFQIGKLAAAFLADACERFEKILVDVIAQSFQWADVEHLNAVFERAFFSLPEETIDSTEKGGECLAGTGRRQQKCVVSLADLRPCLHLRRRRFLEGLVEPARHRREEGGKCAVLLPCSECFLFLYGHRLDSMEQNHLRIAGR